MPTTFRNWLLPLLLTFACFACGPSAKADGELTEQLVKDVIEKPAANAKFVWRSVQIAAPRKASAGEIAAAGLPPNVTVYPVKVDYTRVVGDGARDYVWNYFFYKDDFGAWKQQSNAVNGNHGSDLYYKKP